MSSDSRIRLQLFGSPTVEVGGVPSAGAPAQPRRLAILALLARAGARGVTRERVLNLLWPDAPEDRRRKILTQSLYALRQDLAAPELIEGTTTLRLNPAVVTADVLEFEAALAAGEGARAVALVTGPFLDGFFVPEADEFERWVDGERRVLQRAYAQALRALAQGAATEGRVVEAAGYLHRLVALDPADVEATVELMQVLVTANDTAGALRVAQEHGEYLQREFELPLSAPVRDLAAALQRGAVPLNDQARSGIGTSPADEHAAGPLERSEAGARSWDAATVMPREAPAAAAPSARTWTRAWGWKPGLIAAAGLLIALIWGGLLWGRAGSPPLLMVGEIADFTSDSGRRLGRSVGELLATNLNSVSGVAVVSTARVYELLEGPGVDGGAGRNRFLQVAQRVGASVLYDGSLFEIAPGRYRADLRRIDPRTGAIEANRVAVGADLYALADTLALWVAADLGKEYTVGNFPTHSLEAFRWYLEGIEAMADDDRPVAIAKFTQALGYDSMLVMAEYYRSQLASAQNARIGLDRAYRLSDRLSDRDRRVVELAWARRDRPTEFTRLVESFIDRYPAEIEGPYLKGVVAARRGRLPAAAAALRRALDMSTGGRLALRRRADIAELLVQVLVSLEDIPAARAVAQEWASAQPSSDRAHVNLGWIKGLQDDPDGALREFATGDSLRSLSLAPSSDRTGASIKNSTLAGLLALGRYADFDSVLTYDVGADDVEPGAWFGWWRVEALRQRGRLEEALTEARKVSSYAPMESAHFLGAEVRVLITMGRTAEALRMIDSLTVGMYGIYGRSATGKFIAATSLEMAAAPLAEDGDTNGLRRLVDTLRALQPEGAVGRDASPYHHAQGLLFMVRGDLGRAEQELRAALYNPVVGSSQINLDLAQLLLRRGKAREAAVVLRAALHAPPTFPIAASMQVDRSTLVSQLAVAWALADEPDSADATRARLRRLWDPATPRGPRVFVPPVPGADR